MILTFEAKKGVDQEIEIYFDEEGLDLLIKKLQMLKKQKSPAHDHLMTPSWAGIELTENIQGKGNSIINKVSLGKK